MMASDVTSGTAFAARPCATFKARAFSPSSGSSSATTKPVSTRTAFAMNRFVQVIVRPLGSIPPPTGTFPFGKEQKSTSPGAGAGQRRWRRRQDLVHLDLDAIARTETDDIARDRELVVFGQFEIV